MPWEIGINFRDTAGYVSDGTNETYCLGEVDPYPTSRGGVVFGWVSINGDAGRDRSTSVDRRLAGSNGQTNSGTQGEFRLDLPATGLYTVRIALGDATSSQAYQRLDVFDDASLLFNIVDTDGTASGGFDDAWGTEHTAANWPASNVSKTGQVFATSIIRVKLGSTTAQANTSTIAHLFVSQESTSTLYLPSNRTHISRKVIVAGY